MASELHRPEPRFQIDAFKMAVFTYIDTRHTVVRNKSEYGCVFATVISVISLVLVYSAESSNLRVPENNFITTDGL